MQRNFVVCFLEDIYTPVERTLIEAGRREAVRVTRNIFQDAMGPKFIEAVEAATGRAVDRGARPRQPVELGDQLRHPLPELRCLLLGDAGVPDESPELPVEIRL